MKDLTMRTRQIIRDIQERVETKESERDIEVRGEGRRNTRRDWPKRCVRMGRARYTETCAKHVTPDSTTLVPKSSETNRNERIAGW